MKAVIANSHPRVQKDALRAVRAARERGLRHISIDVDARGLVNARAHDSEGNVVEFQAKGGRLGTIVDAKIIYEIAKFELTPIGQEYLEDPMVWFRGLTPVPQILHAVRLGFNDLLGIAVNTGIPRDDIRDDVINLVYDGLLSVKG